MPKINRNFLNKLKLNMTLKFFFSNDPLIKLKRIQTPMISVYIKATYSMMMRFYLSGSIITLPSLEKGILTKSTN